MTYIRKNERAANINKNPRIGAIVGKAFADMAAPEFDEVTEDGFTYRIRKWRPEEVRGGKGYDKETRLWLLNNRVVDPREGEEFVPATYVKKLISEGFLRKMHGHYWITAKAAARWDLPKVMNCAFPE